MHYLLMLRGLSECHIIACNQTTLTVYLLRAKMTSCFRAESRECTVRQSKKEIHKPVILLELQFSSSFYNPQVPK